MHSGGRNRATCPRKNSKFFRVLHNIEAGTQSWKGSSLSEARTSYAPAMLGSYKHQYRIGLYIFQFTSTHGTKQIPAQDFSNKNMAIKYAETGSNVQT